MGLDLEPPILLPPPPPLHLQTFGPEPEPQNPNPAEHLTLDPKPLSGTFLLELGLWQASLAGTQKSSFIGRHTPNPIP